jgi:hypothetical protein
MAKQLKSATGILGHIQFRLMLEGYGTCEVTFPMPASRVHRIGRNWTVDVPRARSGAEFDAALRAIRDVGAQFDCNNFRAPGEPATQ